MAEETDAPAIAARQLHRGQHLLRPGSQINAAFAQQRAADRHAVRPVVVSRNYGQRNAERAHPGQKRIKQPKRSGRGDRPIEHIPGKDHQIGTLLPQKRKELLPHKIFLIRQKGTPI